MQAFSLSYFTRSWQTRDKCAASWIKMYPSPNFSRLRSTMRTIIYSRLALPRIYYCKDDRKLRLKSLPLIGVENVGWKQEIKQLTVAFCFFFFFFFFFYFFFSSGTISPINWLVNNSKINK